MSEEFQRRVAHGRCEHGSTVPCWADREVIGFDHGGYLPTRQPLPNLSVTPPWDQLRAKSAGVNLPAPSLDSISSKLRPVRSGMR